MSPHDRKAPRATGEQPRLIGVVSDTHGLARPEALRALEGCELILHAGDVGGDEVIEAFAAIAPVVAVRGNNDRGARWPERITVPLGTSRVLVVHDLRDLGPAPPAGIDVVVSGHSHRPSIAEREGILYVNPGSAGPRRFSLPITVARLRRTRGRWRAEIVDVSAPTRATGRRRAGLRRRCDRDARASAAVSRRRG